MTFFCVKQPNASIFYGFTHPFGTVLPIGSDGQTLYSSVVDRIFPALIAWNYYHIMIVRKNGNHAWLSFQIILFNTSTELVAHRLFGSQPHSRIFIPSYRVFSSSQAIFFSVRDSVVSVFSASSWFLDLFIGFYVVCCIVTISLARRTTKTPIITQNLCATDHTPRQLWESNLARKVRPLF